MISPVEMSGMDDGRPAFDAERLRRLVGDVQRLGLATASSVAERFAGMVRGLGDAPRGRAAQGDAASGAAALVDGWRSIVAGMVELAGSIAGGEGATDGPAVEYLDLGTVEPGTVAVGTLYVHNTTGGGSGEIQLRCGDLMGPPGAAISAGAVTLTPDSVGSVAGEGSLHVSVTVAIPPETARGAYRGLVVMSEPPGGSIVVRLSVNGQGDPE